MVTKPEMLGHGTIGDVVSMTFLYGEPKYKLGIADKVMNVGGVDLSQLRIIGELFRSNGCTVLSELVVTIDNRVGLIVRVNVGYGR
jgi:hypothetical protein